VTSAERYPFLAADAAFGQASLRPYLPLKLHHSGRAADTSGLLDTGSAINVLPFEVGLCLGFEWDLQTSSLQLTGNLAGSEARVIILEGVVGQFPSVHLVFAWTRAEGVPTILGQINFFLEFDVCLFRSRSYFEVKPKSPD